VNRPGRILACLADDTRREILDLLSQLGPVSASVLATHLTISRQGVMKHLQVMGEVGVVKASRSGREVCYSVDPGPLHVTARWLDASARAWDTQLTALKRAAEHPRRRDTASPPGRR
jgi:DNA-binding transcriptional ArsR family regulator